VEVSIDWLVKIIGIAFGWIHFVTQTTVSHFCEKSQKWDTARRSNSVVAAGCVAPTAALYLGRRCNAGV